MFIFSVICMFMQTLLPVLNSYSYISRILLYAIQANLSLIIMGHIKPYWCICN